MTSIESLIKKDFLIYLIFNFNKFKLNSKQNIKFVCWCTYVYFDKWLLWQANDFWCF